MLRMYLWRLSLRSDFPKLTIMLLLLMCLPIFLSDPAYITGLMQITGAISFHNRHGFLDGGLIRLVVLRNVLEAFFFLPILLSDPTHIAGEIVPWAYANKSFCFLSIISTFFSAQWFQLIVLWEIVGIFFSISLILLCCLFLSDPAHYYTGEIS